MRRNHAAVASRNDPPASDTRTRASASSRGSAERATTPFAPSSTSSAAALSGALDHDRRRADRGRLDDDDPVALARRRKQQAERRPQLVVHLLGVHEPGRLDRILEPVLADLRQHPLALGAVAEDDRAQAREGARARSATAGTIAVTRFSGMWRPRNTTTGRAG